MQMRRYNPNYIGSGGI